MVKMQLIGHLGKDCVMNDVNGKLVMNFSVAHTEKYKNAQGVLLEKTLWVECNYWTEKTGLAPYLKQGIQVYVEGQPEIRTYQTKDGRFGASMSLRVGAVQLLGSAQSTHQSGGSQPKTYAQEVGMPKSSGGSVPNQNEFDDLPF